MDRPAGVLYRVGEILRSDHSPERSRFWYIVVMVMLAIGGMMMAVAVGAIAPVGYPAQAADVCMVRSGDFCLTRLEIYRAKYIGPYGGDLSGEVVNTGGSAYSRVDLEFNLYDSSGAQIGNASTSILHLGPHAVWHFKTNYRPFDVVTVSVANLSGSLE